MMWRGSKSRLRGGCRQGARPTGTCDRLSPTAMNDERWRRVEDVFHRAADLAPEARPVFLDEACGDDLSLRREVESLLAHKSEDGDTFADAPRVIAHYRILGKLGQGGMGAVYRAMDTKLGREVAIKVLPRSFASDADRMARFTREARVLASLNHPHIAQIYGVEERALVMELVPGATLKGPLPLDKALNYAKQIAEALEAAHEKGIVHRDLKPTNVVVTPDGVVKLLDFGLAGLAPGSPSVERDPMKSPTITMEATHPGMIMGTAAYMSPEQARGKIVDKRADIWAFGVVLYELLTGRRPFRGNDLPETLASVMKDQPDLSVAPVEVRRLLESCLEKDPQNRLRDIADAWRLLQVSPTSSPARSRTWIWAAVALIVLAAIIGAFVRLRPTPTAEPYRLAITPPPGVQFEFANDTGGNAISPDGRKVAFVAGSALWVRPLDSETATKLAGTSSGYCPFWSPDQRSIAFFVSDKLMKIDLASGLVTELATLDAGAGRGGSWNADGTILYSEILRPLWRVSSSGGKPVPVTRLDDARGEDAHYHPLFLPDGDHFLYMIRSRDPANSGIYVGSLNEPRLKERVTTTLSSVAYVAPLGDRPGCLLYCRDGALVAQPFDTTTLRSIGELEVLSDSVGFLLNNQLANFSASPTGVVVIGTAGTPKLQLTWLDRRGNTSTVTCPPDYFSFPRISPDGSRVVMETGGGTGWYAPRIFDFKRGVLSRVDENGGYPAWSADGRNILYFSSAAKALVRKDPDSAQPAEVTGRLGAAPGGPIDPSPDGKFVVVETPQGLTALAIGGRAPARQLTRDAQDHFPRFSPDGRWLAYHSRQEGKYEIFAQDFPEGRTRIQVSNQGGVIPLWRRDQKELFYLTSDARFVAVDVKWDPAGPRFGLPHSLFSSTNLDRTNIGGTNSCDVSADGQHFLCLLPAEKKTYDNQLTVLLNWRTRSRARGNL